MLAYSEIWLSSPLDGLPGAEMVNQLSGCEADKVLDAPLRTIVGCLAEVLPKGPAQTALYWVAGLCILATPIVYKYYLGILAQGAQSEGSIERQDYDRLRASLAGGNLAARLYAKWLSAFLDWIERIFDDAGMADRTLFPRAFGLKTPASLWTAPAFDRCLLLALLYPIATIFLIWAVSGHVGPAEAALGMKPDVPGWARSILAASIGYFSFAAWRATQAMGLKSRVLIGISYFSVLFASVIASAPYVGLAIMVAFVVVPRGPEPRIMAGTSCFAFTLFAVSGYIPSALSVAFAVGFVGLVAICAVIWLGFIAIEHRRHGLFLSVFLTAMIVACLLAADLLSPSEDGNDYGHGALALLLFLGLLTLLNAPFDWASLGLTRALLRRGLELGGWWPYLLALVDACLAGVIIALLALTMVIGVQAFDELAAHGGGKDAAVLPLDALFDGIAKNPGGPEYWWAYALLLSTTIPSLINLAISGMAFTRGIPGLARLLLNWIPEGRDVPDYKRQPAAIGLMFQMFAGAALGIAVQLTIAWFLILRVMPAIGLDLLAMARAVAAFDFPAWIGQLFIGLG